MNHKNKYNLLTVGEMKMNTRDIIKKVLKEYVTKDSIYLKDYLSMSKEQKMEGLPHEYYNFFDDFLVETDYDFEKPKRKDDYGDDEDMFDNEYELVHWLERNDKQTYNSFAKYLYEKISNGELPIPEEEYPAWTYFSDNPQIVKNQWLIHMTDNAEDIARNGFQYGVSDMTKLGLTTRLSFFEKKFGGYNFAYTIPDFLKYARRSYVNGGGYKYGNEAVIFRASGIGVWHYGDNENQVIFYGNTAKDIIPITQGDNAKYAIHNNRGGVLFENDDLDVVVKWLANNYQQYRKRL